MPIYYSWNGGIVQSLINIYHKQYKFINPKPINNGADLPWILILEFWVEAS